MNNAIPSTSAQHAASSANQPTPRYHDAPQMPAMPAGSEHNPAQTDDSPDAILGYN